VWAGGSLGVSEGALESADSAAEDTWETVRTLLQDGQTGGFTG
jgi:hypothetical protein